MPQPPPAAPDDGALGQETAFDDEEVEAKVESIRSVSSLLHSGHGIAIED